MCLIVLAIDVHPEWPLVVAANRDEYFQRPALALHAWENSPVIAGKDLTGGGTWMGITRNGRFAALTNYRDPAESVSDPLSRGMLVRRFLESDQPAPDYLEAIASQGHRYPGFNLLTGSRDDIWYFSNRDKSGYRKLKPGIHGLSNHLLNTPWPKVVGAKRDLDNLLVSQENLNSGHNINRLLDLMNNREPAPDAQLPDTGVGKQAEKVLSSRFIQAPVMNYGTRCTTALLMDKNEHQLMIERTWSSQGEVEDEVTLYF